MDLAVLIALAGTWRGSGSGSYPTITEFEYTEELVIEPVPGRPVAHWRSRTADGRTREPRHAESGFLRITQSGAELVLAHNFGIVEVSVGSVTDGTLEVSSSSVVSKVVDRVVRVYRFDGDHLEYDMSMAAVGMPLTHHLSATLLR
jgi:hypothetical protein